MKFVLAFLLLIGVSCQIGRGDCAPAETLLGDLTETMSYGVQYVKDTFSSYMPAIFIPSTPEPSLMDDVEDMAEGAEQMTKDTMDSITNNMKDMAEGAEQMTKDTMDSMADAMD